MSFITKTKFLKALVYSLLKVSKSVINDYTGMLILHDLIQFIIILLVYCTRECVAASTNYAAYVHFPW